MGAGGRDRAVINLRSSTDWRLQRQRQSTTRPHRIQPHEGESPWPIKQLDADIGPWVLGGLSINFTQALDKNAEICASANHDDFLSRYEALPEIFWNATNLVEQKR